MSTISLSGNSMECVLGKGSFTNLGQSFCNVKKSSESLSKALGSLKDKIDVVKESVKVSTSQESVKHSDNCEKNKKSALTVAYDKLDAFVSDVGTIDSKVSDKINDRKDSFYDKYTYLKPQCEKSGKEKWNEFWTGVGEGLLTALDGVWSVVKSLAIGIAEWCKEVFSNVISAVTAIVIIVAAIVICIVCAPEIIAMIAIVVCAASAIYGLVDIGFMLATGKDIPGFLEDKGHENWAAFFRGFDFGMTIASLILPVGAAIKTTMKLGGQTFMSASKKWLKNSFKSLGSSFKNIGKNIKKIFTCSGKPGFKGVMKSIGMSLWKGFKGITGIDDIARLRELRNFKQCKAGWIISYSDKHWFFDEKNMSLLPKSDEAEKAIETANKIFADNGSDKVIKSIPLKKNSGFIDIDWDAISFKTLGSKDKFNMKNLDLSLSDGTLRNQIYGNPNSRANIALNNGITSGSEGYQLFLSNGPEKGGIYNNMGLTAHENFNLKTENIVPTFIHNRGKGGNGAGIFHHGGIANERRLFRLIQMDLDVLTRNIGITIGKMSSKTAMEE